MRFNLSPALSGKHVVSLTTRDLRPWRDALATHLAATTVNRTTTALKAALNLAADQDELITSRRPWDVGLATIEGAEEARNVILSDNQVKAVVAAAGARSAEFGRPIGPILA